VLALVLALAHDLPDAQSRGLLLLNGDYHVAKASPSAGLYMETLGAVVLIITGGCGLVLAGPPRPRGGSDVAREIRDLSREAGSRTHRHRPSEG
jgi:hypothetical protein